MVYRHGQNNDDSTFTITDKVYDRAIPIELNERADAFECEPHEHVHVTADHLRVSLPRKAKVEYVIDDDLLEKMHKLDQYLQTRFSCTWQPYHRAESTACPRVYVACGGTELGGMDYIIARKVLEKFESMNVSFVRDEMKGLIEYIEKTFGEGGPCPIPSCICSGSRTSTNAVSAGRGTRQSVAFAQCGVVTPFTDRSNLME